MLNNLLISMSLVFTAAFPTARHLTWRGVRSLSSCHRPTLSNPLRPPQLFPNFGGKTNLKFGLLTTLLRGGSATPISSSSSSSSSSSCLSSTLVPAQAAPKEIFRLDYTPPKNWVPNVELSFDITENLTTVSSALQVHSNSEDSEGWSDIVLDGDSTSTTLLSVSINKDPPLPPSSYTLSPTHLKIHGAALPPSSKSLILHTVVTTIPETNTQLSGLYKSGPMYCTQCEAEGFRRITYFPDRPDNMATFSKVSITADASYPVLLSNGNLISTTTDAATNRKTVIWSDPFPKPAYLFAIVAGNLGSIKDTYTTTSGRVVDLEIFSELHSITKLSHAMESLKNSMKWDEDTFNLEYDLDVYNVVAVSDFNMGAMENKGLNVFNSALVLADAETATDSDFRRVEGVIGHEYFHNWTGNRVTLRDWFQLTLKEGLTVFRDQEFSGAMGSPAVTRIENVRSLRSRQFAEDAGPMKHPIRPESYIAMDNFYTSTVYTKGSEVVRMYNTLLTPAGFRKGMDLYFKRHDGKAITCDDFRAAMADANDVDLTQFERWYTQAGTPQVQYDFSYDSRTGEFKLDLFQSTPTQENNEAFHIPVSFGIIDEISGEVLPTTTLELIHDSQSFSFSLAPNLSNPVPSILRAFSAPVKLQRANNKSDTTIMAVLAASDTDGFNRWDATQKLTTNVIFQTLKRDLGAAFKLVSEDEEDDGDDLMMNEEGEELFAPVFKAFRNTLQDEKISDESIRAYSLILPSESELTELTNGPVDPLAIKKARAFVKRALANRNSKNLFEKYGKLSREVESETEFKVDNVSIGRRAIRNVLLDYLTAFKNDEGEIKSSAELAYAHFEDSNCMTDKMAGLSSLVSLSGNKIADELRGKALAKFFKDAEGDALVLDKWFAVQAMSDVKNALGEVRGLLEHEEFSFKNPNRCRSLVSVFAANTGGFHNLDGSGYEFIGEMVVKMDGLNPQISARLVGSLVGWKKFDERRGLKMQKELLKILNDLGDEISHDLFEVVTKSLR